MTSFKQTLQRKLILALLVLPDLLSGAFAFQSPATTGPFATGVFDSELTDNQYPSNFLNDVSGRRIMFRAWYPVCEKENLLLNESNATIATCQTNGESTNLGRRRLYFESGEWEAYFSVPAVPEITQMFDHAQSYLNAPPMNGTSSSEFPVVIYMHGYTMWVSDNTALLEEIASHGYTVFAIGSPGFARGVLYPSDQLEVTAAYDYPEINATMANTSLPTNPLAEPYSDDLQVRHDRMESCLQRGGGAIVFPRVTDDMLALADHLDQQSSGNAADSITKQLIGNNGLEKVVYMGYSFGGAAAGSAAQQDLRAVGVINIDGLHQSLDLFGTTVLTPYLTFTSNDERSTFYYNELFFEPLESMGSSSTVTRLLAPNGTSHGDFSDLRFFSQPLRQFWFGLNHTIDGGALHAGLVDFCVGFIGKYLGEGEWSPEESFSRFPGTEAIDVSYVANWKEEEQVPAGDSPAEEQVPADDSPAEEQVPAEDSSASRMIVGWSALSVMLYSIVFLTDIQVIN